MCFQKKKTLESFDSRVSMRKAGLEPTDSPGKYDKMEVLQCQQCPGPQWGPQKLSFIDGL